MRRSLILILGILIQINSYSQNVTKEFASFSDSLCCDLQNHFRCRGSLKIRKVNASYNRLDFYFSRSLADYPFRKADLAWFKSAMTERLPEAYSGYAIGNIYSSDIRLEEFLKTYKVPDPKTAFRFIEEKGRKNCSRGLDRRYIALWQSHGKYYENGEGRWKWQRAALNTTIEDIYTQSYVIPFLIPMLENAGAYVVTPRERDINRFETIADNDSSFVKDRELPGMRRQGRYYEIGKWENCGSGFADTVSVYSGDANPFTAGTARKSKCSVNSNATTSAVWEFDFPQKGHYSVYISYKSLENSSSCAHYCVNHAAGKSEFIVNQRIAGGTWVYLGSFDFEGKGIVTLDNSCPAGRNPVKGSVITADAVRIGGGMGKIARCGNSSGIPSYLEGAMYNLQWSGFDKSVWGNEDSEYINEYSCRPYWVKALKDDYGVPVDLALAIHSDGGEVSADKTIGTLAIYSLFCKNSRKFSSGLDRMTCRELSLFVQDEIVDEIRRDWTDEWTRRGVRNRQYREASQGDVPSVILELLSHQNPPDMKYGLDPEFRFDVCRAIYKGVLKYLASLYGYSYAVQPLPVKDFSAIWTENGKIRLSWKPSVDPAEPSAAPKAYILYTRIDEGPFDNGREIMEKSTIVDVMPGHVYSFKVEAWNDGGKSFPSEILAAGKPVESRGEGVVVVNNFTRTSGPGWFEDERYAGFDVTKNAGVPYRYDISYSGAVYDFNRNSQWKSNDLPGFGASFSDYDTAIIAGNTFDYVAQHGRALMELGRAFCSTSASAFKGNEAKVLDLVCGNQASTLPMKGGEVRHRVFTKQLMTALDKFAEAGGNIIISGSRIATDATAEIYPGAKGDDLSNYLASRLGYVLVSSVAGKDGKIGKYEYFCTPNETFYFASDCDAIRSAGRGKILMRYQQGQLPAAVYYNAGNYKAVSFGFPLETVKRPEDLRELLGLALSKF